MTSHSLSSHVTHPRGHISRGFHQDGVSLQQSEKPAPICSFVLVFCPSPVSSVVYSQIWLQPVSRMISQLCLAVGESCSFFSPCPLRRISASLALGNLPASWALSLLATPPLFQPSFPSERGKQNARPLGAPTCIPPEALIGVAALPFHAVCTLELLFLGAILHPLATGAP